MTSASVAFGGLPLMDEAGPVRTPSAAEPTATSGAEATIDLVHRAQLGDQAATDELFARYETRLRRWAHGRLPAQARGALDTQDLAHDALTRVFQKLQTFEPRHEGAFRDYVWTTMWNCIRDLARKHQRRGPVDSIEGHDIPTSAPSPLEEAIGRDALQRYEAAMERLRPDEREAVIMRIELGLSHADVARALGKSSAAAAHMVVSRALVKLAKEMAHDGKRAQ